MKQKNTMIIVLVMLIMLVFNSCEQTEISIPISQVQNNTNATNIKEVNINLSKINLSDVCFPNKKTVIEIFGPDADLSQFCILENNETSTNKTQNISETKNISSEKQTINTTSNVSFINATPINISTQSNITINQTSNTSNESNNTIITLNNSNYILNTSEIGTEILEKAAFLKTIVINETQAIRLKINAYDPDNDKIKIYYSWPLNKDGFWQTKQGDKGTYIVNITVSDGKTNVTAKVRIIVKDLNLAPEVEIPENITVKEGEVINLTPKVFDVDNDSIKIYYIGWLDQPIYETTYLDAGTYKEKIIVSDGVHNVTKYVTIHVLNVNRLPQVNITDEIYTIGGNLIHLEPKIFDPDTDDTIKIYYFDPFNASGYWLIPKMFNKTITTKIVVSDGHVNVTKEITIHVKRFNTAPRFKARNITIYENTTLNLKEFVHDPENDTIELKVSGDFSDTIRHFDFNSNGTYLLRLKACDYELCNETNFTIVVRNLNRAPVIENVPNEIITEETSFIRLEPQVYDPDGDKVSYYCTKPLNKSCEWQTDYNSSGVYNVTIIATDGIKEVNKTITLTVKNKNRAPVIENISDIYVKEGEVIKIMPIVYDPDGDKVTWHLEGWLNTTEYKTTYDDAGNYTEKIIASDGNITVEKEFHIYVEDVNRPPVIVGVIVE